MIAITNCMNTLIKRLKMRLFLKLSLMTACLCSLTFQANASIPPRQLMENHVVLKPAFYHDETTAADIEKVIPLNMQPTTDQSAVVSRIADHSLDRFFNSPEVQQSSIGQTAHEVQEKMQTDVSFGGEEEGSIRHVFKMQMLAFQNTARVDYTGLMDAKLFYHINDARFEVELLEKLGRKDLVFSHNGTRTETLNQVALRWNF